MMQAPQWCDHNVFNGCCPYHSSYYASNSGCRASRSTNVPGALTIYQQIYSASSSIRTDATDDSKPQSSILPGSQKSSSICWIENRAIINQIILKVIIHLNTGQEIVMVENYLPIHFRCMPVHYKSCSRLALIVGKVGGKKISNVRRREMVSNSC